MGEYGLTLVGSTVNGALSCTGNSAEVSDPRVPNRIKGAPGGDCAGLDDGRTSQAHRYRFEHGSRRPNWPSVPISAASAALDPDFVMHV